MNSRKSIVVFPGRTRAQIPVEVADDVLLVDDASTDHTAALAAQPGVSCIEHPINPGYASPDVARR